MVTKAFIAALPGTGSNIYKVRIPIFEPAGIENSAANSSVYNATLCYTPGVTSGYEVGDAVFVTFEDNLYENAVILGKLQLQADVGEPRGSASLKGLSVEGPVELPESTVIDGVPAQDIATAVSNVRDLFDSVDGKYAQKDKPNTFTASNVFDADTSHKADVAIQDASLALYKKTPAGPAFKTDMARFDALGLLLTHRSSTPRPGPQPAGAEGYVAFPAAKHLPEYTSTLPTPALATTLDSKRIVVSVELVRSPQQSPKLFIGLSGLSSSDVLMSYKLFLFKTSVCKGHKAPLSYGRTRLSHPENYDSTVKNRAKLGYGNLADTFVGGAHAGSVLYPAVPSWMPHGGFMQTEWAIDAEAIAAGGVTIDIGQELLSLLRPALAVGSSDPEWHWSAVLGTKSAGIYSTGCMKFKFGLVSDAGDLVSLSPASFCFARRYDPQLQTPPNEVDMVKFTPTLPDGVAADLDLSTTFMSVK